MIPLNFGFGSRTGDKHWLELVDFYSFYNILLVLMLRFVSFPYFVFLCLSYRHTRVCIFSSFILLYHCKQLG
jgi:hypothetical protein